MIVSRAASQHCCLLFKLLFYLKKNQSSYETSSNLSWDEFFDFPVYDQSDEDVPLFSDEEENKSDPPAPAYMDPLVTNALPDLHMVPDAPTDMYKVPIALPYMYEVPNASQDMDEVPTSPADCIQAGPNTFVEGVPKF